MRTIVDTSAWIEFFNRGDGELAARVARLVEADEAVLTGLVRCELLAGFRSDATFVKARGILAAFEEVDDSSLAVRERAVEIYRSCRKRGVTVRSLVDCLIAAAALSADLPVLHRDRDFAAIAKRFPLRAAQ
jgi:predicted nucleic acid-binding protein